MDVDPSKVKVVAFDCVNTVFDVSHMDHAELKAYIDQTRRLPWMPLDVQVKWLASKAHQDSAPGINRLSNKRVTATCSNWPATVLSTISARAGINWSAIIPMETTRSYKPSPMSYTNVARVCGVDLRDVLMVTANEEAPDLEMARKLGMQSILVDRKNKYEGKLPRTIIELADILLGGPHPWISH